MSTTATVAAGTATTVASVDSRSWPVRRVPEPAGGDEDDGQGRRQLHRRRQPAQHQSGDEPVLGGQGQTGNEESEHQRVVVARGHSKLNSASGLSTPSHSAIPPSTPKVRANRGQVPHEHPHAHELEGPQRQDLGGDRAPNTAAMPLVAATNNGPYGAGVLRHTLAIEPRTWPGPSTTGPTE